MHIHIFLVIATLFYLGLCAPRKRDTTVSIAKTTLPATTATIAKTAPTVIHSTSTAKTTSIAKTTSTPKTTSSPKPTSTSKKTTSTSTSKKTTSTSKKSTSTSKKSTSTSKKTTSTSKKTTSTSKKPTSTAKKTTSTSKKTTSTAKKTTSTTKKTTSTAKPVTSTADAGGTAVKKTTSTTTKSTASATSTGKRGLSFNDPYLTGFFGLSGQKSQVTWSYNWASDPYYGEYADNNTYNSALEYVPILWSNAAALTSIWDTNVANAIKNYGTKHVYAFNEPDLCSSGSACMNVSTAVSAYKQYLDPLANKVHVGAPAVTNGVGEGIGIDYMKQFVGNCTSCTIDFIPIHWYGAYDGETNFKAFVKSFYTEFKKPVWITEFQPQGGTTAQTIAFLENVMPWLDKQTYVKYYAYFGDFNEGSPYLLNQNDTVTEIGTIYNTYTKTE